MSPDILLVARGVLKSQKDQAFFARHVHVSVRAWRQTRNDFMSILNRWEFGKIPYLTLWCMLLR